LVTTVNKSTNSCDKNHLPIQVKADGLQGTESFETFTEGVQTLICDFIAPVSRLSNLSYKSHLPHKIEGKRLQGIDYFEISSEVGQTLICNFLAPSANQQTPFANNIYP